jgi:hypothetical protein
MVKGLEFRVLNFREFWVSGFGFRVLGVGFRVSGLRFRVQGTGFREGSAISRFRV